MPKYLVTLEFDVHDPVELADHVASEIAKIGHLSYSSDRKGFIDDKTVADLEFLFRSNDACPGAFINVVDVRPKD